MPTTPSRKIVVGDVFMWREGGWDTPPIHTDTGDVIKVWL
jgi:hypothetical protein